MAVKKKKKKSIKTLSGRPSKRGRTGHPGEYKVPRSEKQRRFFFAHKIPFKTKSGRILINKKGKILAGRKKK